MSANYKLVRIADGAEVAINGSLLVGRLEECGLRITQGLPSRRHAQVTVVGQSVWVEDLGSVNGTFINGTRITAKSQLTSGDRVRFDVEEFQFHVNIEALPQTSAPTQASAPTMYRPLSQELAERPPPEPASARVAQPAAATPQPPKDAASDNPAPKAESVAQPQPATRPLETPPATPPTVPLATSEPAPAPSKPAVKPPAEPSAEASGMFKRPGAWADPDYDGGANKTKFMDPSALKSLHATPKVATPAGASATPCLLIASGASSGARIELNNARGAAEWTIGSGADCQIVIPDDGVSALHAKLINDGTRWKLVDQMSANGTYVNGKRSTVSYLAGGDRILLGPVECEIRLPATAQAVAPLVASETQNKKPMLIAAAVGGAVVLFAIVWAVWLR